MSETAFVPGISSLVTMTNSCHGTPASNAMLWIRPRGTVLRMVAPCSMPGTIYIIDVFGRSGKLAQNLFALDWQANNAKSHVLLYLSSWPIESTFKQAPRSRSPSR